MEDADRDNDGKISLKEFQECVHLLKLELTKPEILILFEKLDSSESGKFRCDDLLDLVFKDTERESTPPISRSKPKSDVASIIEDIRDSIVSELGPGAKSARAVKRIFSDMDLNNDGKIDRKEFQKAMRMLKVPVGEQEMDIIFDKYDRHGNGRLDYTEFIDLLDFHAPVKEERVERDHRDESASLTSIIRDIKEAIAEELGPGEHSAKAMKRVFADIDLDGDGVVDKFEFVKAMKMLGVPVSDSKVDVLFEKFEKSRGYFDYTDFVHFLDFQSKDEVADILKEIQDGIMDYLGPGAESVREVKRIFADIDIDGNGTVDKSEFTKAMRFLKIPVGEKTIDKIYALYAHNQRKDRIDYSDFISLLDFHPKGGDRGSRSQIDSDRRRDSSRERFDARK